MLRTFLRLLSPPSKPAPLENVSGRSVVLYAHLDDSSVVQEGASSRRDRASTVNHREWLLSMKLEHTQLCSPIRCERLRGLGIVTAGELVAANPDVLAAEFAAPQKALQIIKRYRRAIRFAAAVPGMMPRDALLLISIHRRSVRGLAIESPAVLYRDLQRYAESSRGRKLLRGRRLPSMRRLKRWIAACEPATRTSAVAGQATSTQRLPMAYARAA